MRPAAAAEGRPVAQFDVAAVDGQRHAADDSLGDFMAGTLVNLRHRRPGDAHLLRTFGVGAALKVDQPNGLVFVQGQHDLAFGTFPVWRKPRPTRPPADPSAFRRSRHILTSFPTYVDNIVTHLGEKRKGDLLCLIPSPKKIIIKGIPVYVAQMDRATAS